MLKILIVFGTRPEAIKFAPVLKELKKFPKKFKIIVLVSGQHDQLLKPLLKLFDIVPNKNLKVMTTDQSLGDVFSKVFLNTEKVISQTKPDYLMVQGDTTTAVAAAWAGFLGQIKIIHLEAGLRTGDPQDPYPEEINRKIIDQLSSVLFATTQRAFKNLVSEGIPRSKVVLTGNTVIDCLKSFEKSFQKSAENHILLTVHRRESFGVHLDNIFKAVSIIAKKFPNIKIIFPVHPNPNVANPAKKILRDIKNIQLLPPLDYLDFIKLMNESILILTDSGGVIEEAAFLGKPVLILREKTERIESVENGVAFLVGRDSRKIVTLASEIISNTEKRTKMAKKIFDYGRGQAATQIVRYLLKLREDSLISI